MNTSVLDLSHKIEEDELAQPCFVKLGHRPELDGFRGISIILVFIHHLYHTILPGGFLGVDMFFVLSGFLITSLLLEEWNQYQTISLKNFYIRRVFRLMPAIFFIVIVSGCYAVFLVDKKIQQNTIQGIWLTLVYISNWLYAFNLFSADNPLGVTWSLAIEEQFYFVFPIILFFALKYKCGRKRIISILTFLVVGIGFHRTILAAQGVETMRLYYATDTRADALLIGCLSACLVSWNLFPFEKMKEYFRIATVLSLSLLVLMIATISVSDTFLYNLGGYSLIALSVAVSLLYLVKYQPKVAVKALSFPPLVWIGRISYGLYLWHWAVRYFIYQDQQLPQSNWQLLSVIVFSFAFTIISFYLVEKPFLRLKTRFSRANN